MDEVNACIAASSESEELIDKPEKDRRKLRVSGPFTVEAVQPAEESINDDSSIGGEPEEALDTFESEDPNRGSTNAEAYLDKMIRLLRNGSVRFPDDQALKFATLEPLEGEILHAEGNWEDSNAPPRVVVVFGPQYGAVTAKQVRNAYRLRLNGVTRNWSLRASVSMLLHKTLLMPIRIRESTPTWHTSIPMWIWTICSSRPPPAKYSLCLGDHVPKSNRLTTGSISSRWRV